MNIAVASDFPTVSSNVSPHREAVADPRSPSRLHPGVIRFTAAAYIAMTSALLIGFAGPADLQVPFYIIALCLVVFIALPWWMGRSATKFWRRSESAEPPMGSFRQFLNGSFETETGRGSGIGALTLVATVPVSLTIGAVAMAIIADVIR